MTGNLTTFSLISLEKAMAPHSSTLAWKIPWTEEPGRLQSRGSWRVGHDWVPSLSLFPFMHWRRKWQPTPVFLPGESQGRWSLVGCGLWGHTESDTSEATQQQQQQPTIYTNNVIEGKRIIIPLPFGLSLRISKPQVESTGRMHISSEVKTAELVLCRLSSALLRAEYMLQV